MNASANTDEKNYAQQFKVNSEKLRAHTGEKHCYVEFSNHNNYCYW